jgi:hypothetical protein
LIGVLPGGTVACTSLVGEGAELKYLKALKLAAGNDVTPLLPYCLAGLACVVGLRRDTPESGRLWCLKEMAEKRTESRIEPLARARWDRIILPLQASPEFVSGFEVAYSASLEDAVDKLIVRASSAIQKEGALPR